MALPSPVSRGAEHGCHDTARVWHAPRGDARGEAARILRQGALVPSSTLSASAAWLVGLALLTACGPGPGSFEVRMAWGAGGPPEVEAAFIHADVREVELDGAGRPRVARGRVLGEATPVSLGAVRAGDAEVRFTQIPNGERRLVVVEVRAGETRRAELLRYGVSEPFAIVEGESTVVTVTAGLGAPPRARAIGVDGFADDAEVFVRSEAIPLRLTFDAAVHAEVSGFDTFPPDDTLCLGLGQAPAACNARARAAVVSAVADGCEVRAGTENPCTYAVLWDLGAGLADDCGLSAADPSARADRCARTVYVRGFDAAGVASEPEQRDVVLDTRAPTLRGASIDYAAPPAGALLEPTEAALGARIRLELAASEPIRDPPELLVATATGGATLRLTLSPRARDALGATYTATVTEVAQPTGAYRLELALRDRAGNVGEVSAALPVIRVRTGRPALLVDQARVSYLRAPVGRATPEVLGRYTAPPGPRRFAVGPADPLDDTPTLPADTFRLSDGPAAALRVWADGARDVLLLPLVRPDARGAWPRDALELPGLDTPRVYVTALDAAGNESEPILVETVWLVGSSAAVRGSPHALTVSTDADAPRAPQLQLDVSGAADAPDGRPVQRGTSLTWRRYGGLEGAPGVFVWATGMTWDGTLGELQFTNDAGVERAETLSWDGFSVTNRTSRTAGLGLRKVREMTFDARRGQSVGLSQDKTMLWDGLGWTVATATVGPGPLLNTWMTYDPANEEVLTFGGVRPDEFTVQDTTWTWDGMRWRQRAATGPGPRNWHRMTYDPTSGHVVLFGGLRHQIGLDPVTPPDNAMWAWTGEAWGVVAPAQTGTAAPAARYGHVMSYDLASRTVIVAAGSDATTGRTLTDSWSWDGRRWTRLDSGTAPYSMYGSGHDHRRGRPVMWGGLWSATMNAWTRGRWTPVGDFDRPPLGYGRLTVHDGARGRTLVFGRSHPGSTWDAWAWDGIAWTVSSTTGPDAFTPLDAMHIAYDAARDRVVLVGATQTWLFDGVRWTEAVGPSPPPRRAAAMTYDAARRRVVLFGGYGPAPGDPPRADTWIWDGAAWTEVNGRAPPARGEAMLVDDVGHAQLVLSGGAAGDAPGAAALDDTWVWDGATWVERTPPGARPRGGSGPAVYHAAVGRVIWAVRGGSQPGLWAWDGMSWTQLILPGVAPTLEPGSGLVYVPSEGAAFFRGGLSQQQWRLEAAPAAVQLAIRLDEEVPIERVEDVRIRGACGGRSPRGDGARVVGWSTRGLVGGWDLLARTTASPTASSGTAFDYRPGVDAASVAQHLIVPSQRALYLQCRPDVEVTDAGRGPAEVALDYLEARIKYRLTPEAR